MTLKNIHITKVLRSDIEIEINRTTDLTIDRDK